MKPRSIGVFCMVSVLATTSMVLAQQSKLSQEQKTPLAEVRPEKKPNIIVFNASGTPQPTQKPGRPKGVPPFRPLSKAEKIRIVQEIPGLPHTFLSVTPYLTLSPMHVLDPRGALDLHWPAVTSWASASYADFPSRDENDAKAFNAKTVEVFLAADPGNLYQVNFDVFTFPVPAGFKTPEWLITVQGGDPIPCKPFQPGENYVSAVVSTIPQSGIYRVTLQVCPPSADTGGGHAYPEWVFGFVEVTKFVPSST